MRLVCTAPLQVRAPGAAEERRADRRLCAGRPRPLACAAAAAARSPRPARCRSSAVLAGWSPGSWSFCLDLHKAGGGPLGPAVTPVNPNSHPAGRKNSGARRQDWGRGGAWGQRPVVSCQPRAAALRPAVMFTQVPTVVLRAADKCKTMRSERHLLLETHAEANAETTQAP